MKITYLWEAPGGGIWGPGVVSDLLGQTFILEGKHAKVISCHLTEDGPLDVTIEIEEDDDASFGHPI